MLAVLRLRPPPLLASALTLFQLVYRGTVVLWLLLWSLL
jgi:hypothetical protein